MKIKLALIAALLAPLALAALAPNVASAQSLILDTGTPTTGSGASSPALLNTKNWYAAEFTVDPGETITQLSAYLTQGGGEVNDTFTWDLYSAGGSFIGATSATREGTTDSTTGTFLANGWNSVAVDWTPTAGTYWLALQVSSTTQTTGLDLPVEPSLTSGTAPATAFAFEGTSGKYALDTTTGVGMQVSAVPLPSAVWFMGSGLFGLGSIMRRRALIRQG